MYEGFLLDLLLTAAINIIPAAAMLLISGPIFDRAKAIKTCVAIGILALLITILFLELGNADEAPKVIPEVFYGYFNYLILHKIPVNRRSRQMNAHLSGDFSSDVQDDVSPKGSKKRRKFTVSFIATLVLLLFTNAFWFISYSDLKNEHLECETKIKSLEMYVDSLKNQLSNAEEDAENYDEFEMHLDEWKEQQKKERDEEIAEWNRNNPDHPLDPETGQPL